MTTLSRSWRLIDTGPLDGLANMSVDEALLNCFDPQRSAPVLRLYGWEPPTLSFGRFQKREEVLDIGKCAAAGVEVVRRITGGGVIYHTAELTYAIVCAPHHIPPAASIKESFRILTEFLIRFYRRLGLTACYAADRPSDGARLGERTAFCFAGRESYDILVGDRKIGGNAQRRQKNVIFQHGSIPLMNCAALGATFMTVPPAGIADCVTSLADFGVERPLDELKAHLVEGFRETISGDLTASSLMAEEEREVSRLMTRGEREP